MREAMIRVSDPERMTKLAIADTAVMSDANGVRNPTARETDINRDTANRMWKEDPPLRFAVSIRKVAATEIRSINKAKPGPPCGNIENNRCTVLSLAAFGGSAYPN